MSSIFAPMAAPKRRLFFCITLILFIYASSEILPDDYEAEQSDDPILKIKHEQLLSKILNLESNIDERSHEISSKDERIKQLETIILEKSNSLASLHSEIHSLEKKESVDAKEQEGEAHLRAEELLKQVENLKEEITKQNTKKHVLETRINAAETKIAELNAKLEKLQSINEEQTIRIRNTEGALQKAEEERIRVQLKATLHSKDLAEVHESWLPPWLAVHLFHYKSLMVTHWDVYGKPALNVAVQKAVEMKTQVQKWAQPHIDQLHNKWVPTIKEQWVRLVTNMEPHVQTLTAKTVEFSKKTLKPRITNIQTIVDSYIKEAKKLTKPYSNQLSKTLKPHINKVHIFLKPYTKKILRGYKRLSKTTLKYHRRARVNIHEMLKNNEITRPLATNELVWLMASAFMLFPVMVVLSWVSNLFSKKSKRRTRTSHASHSRRRAKRVHPEKAKTIN